MHLPKAKGNTEDDTPIIPVPTAVMNELALTASFLPLLSIIMLAPMLPNRPPTVNTDVTTEKVASDMGMHGGIP